MVTRDSKSTTTAKTYTTDTDEWDPGPIFKLFGLGEKDQTTTTFSNATGTDVSSTVTMNAAMVAGPQDNFTVGIFYDNLFGTFAFQQARPSPPSNRFEGDGAAPAQQITLLAGGNIFRTVADKERPLRVSFAGDAGGPCDAHDRQSDFARPVTVLPIVIRQASLVDASRSPVKASQ